MIYNVFVYHVRYAPIFGAVKRLLILFLMTCHGEGSGINSYYIIGPLYGPNLSSNVKVNVILFHFIQTKDDLLFSKCT